MQRQGISNLNRDILGVDVVLRLEIEINKVKRKLRDFSWLKVEMTLRKVTINVFSV